MTHFPCRVHTILAFIFSMLVTAHGLVEISPTMSSSSSTTAFPSSSSVALTPIPTPTPVPTTQPTSSTKACDASPCKNNGVCTNVPPTNTDFECACPGGWGGKICNEPTKSIAMDVQVLEIDAGLKITPNASLAIRNLLLDPTSQLFKDACAVMTALLEKSLRADGTLTVEKITCKRIYFASLHVEYVLELPQNSTDTVSTVQSAATNGFKKTATDTSNNAVVIDNTLRADDLNECLQPIGYCDASAKCVNTITSYKCTCEPDYQLIDGSKCVKKTSTSDNDVLIIVLISVFSGLFLLLVLIVIVLALRRRHSQAIINKEQSVQLGYEEPVLDYGFSRLRASTKPVFERSSSRDPNMKNVAPSSSYIRAPETEDYIQAARTERAQRVFEVYYK